MVDLVCYAMIPSHLDNRRASNQPRATTNEKQIIIFDDCQRATNNT